MIIIFCAKFIRKSVVVSRNDDSLAFLWKKERKSKNNGVTLQPLSIF